MSVAPPLRVLSLFLAALGACWLEGCSSGCLGVCDAGVVLKVIDQTTRETLCDAEVVLDTKSGSVTLPPSRMADAEFPEFCRFHAGCGAGTYPFRIGKPGYRTESRTVVVSGPDGCPTNAPQYVTIELSREP